MLIKKTVAYIVVMAFTLSYASLALAAAPNRWLTLSKNTEGPRYIVDSTGKAFPLFGMARSQYCAKVDEDPVYNGIDGLCKYFKNAGCNSIRLAIGLNTMTNKTADFIEESGGYNEAGINKFIEEYVDPEVQAIIANGMYVVLDLHEYPPALPKGDVNPSLIIQYARDHYIPIWKELSKKYKNEPMVAMYEVWNEPYAADQGSLKIGGDGKISEGTYKGYDWNSAVRQFYIDCVREIRKNDTRHMILVSDFNAGWGSAWAITWSKYKNAVDPGYNNVLYSAHAAKDHLLGFVYDDYWANTSSNNNICIQFGEVETEQWMATEQSMKDFIEMLGDRSTSHYYSAFLWRPHKSIVNNNDYITVWSDFAKSYVKRLDTGNSVSSGYSSVKSSSAVSYNLSSSASSSKQDLKSSVVEKSDISINSINVSTESSYVASVKNSSAIDYNKQNDDTYTPVIIIAIASILLISAVIAGVLIFRKRHKI